MVSRITVTVADEVTVWPSRPLDASHPILFLEHYSSKYETEEQYPTISWLWRRNRDLLSPFFAFPER